MTFTPDTHVIRTPDGGAVIVCTMCENVKFVRRRDGDAAATAFAWQAVRSYRRAVREVRGRLARRRMIAAYLCAKRTARHG